MSTGKIQQQQQITRTTTPSSASSNNNFHTINIDLNTPQKHHDRQGQDGELNNESLVKARRSFRNWIRRIFVGKKEHEEMYERRHNKKLNWFKNEIRRHVAEFIGTFFLILFVCGIQINQGMYPNGGVSNVDKGLVSGLVLIGLIFSFGRLSGSHFNPCVTLAFLLRGTFNFFRFLTYITFQFAGAVSAAAVLYGLFGIVDELGTTVPGPGLDNSHVLGIEILLTFLLITVVLSTAEDSNIIDATAGLAVASVFGAIETWGWNFTGASVNPWRTIAPTMIAGYAWNTYWIYIVGALIGTILAVLVQRLLVAGTPQKETKHLGKLMARAPTGELFVIDIRKQL